MREELLGCLVMFKELQARCQGSRKLILVIVAIALLLDNMLLTSIVPIFPTYLYYLNHPNCTSEDDCSDAPLPTVAAAAAGGVAYQENWENQHPGQDYNSSALLFYQTHQQMLDAVSTRAPHRHGINHEDLKAENVPLGIMYSAKALMQLITNPFIGPLTYRIGYSIPMFAGFVIMFISTIIFAFGNSYAVLFVARALQGVGSSCSSVSGMGMLAECYPDDKERGNAMGLALGGLALGVLIGPTFGGIMYEYFNKTAPFLVLAFLALGDGLLQLLVLKPMVRPQEKKAPTLTELIQDPYIIVAAGAITFANMGIGMLEPSLPIWMMDRMNSSKLEQGTIFLPASISYLIGTNLFGPLGHIMGRSMAAFLGLILSGVSLIFIPFATSQRHLILPTAGLGFAIGMVDSSMMPELGNLVDLRHSNVYGSVYSIGDVAFCLGFFIGPALSGTLIENIGFDAMMYGIAVINFMYAPLLYFLRNPPVRNEERVNLLNEQKSMSYVNFKNCEED